MRSAEGAVQRDLFECAPEGRELDVVELSNEQLRDAASMDGGGLGQSLDPRIGQRNDYATSVRIGAGTRDEAFVNQVGDPARHPRAGDERPVGQVRHAQLPVGEGELGEHVEVGKGQIGLSLEVRLELPHERCMRPKQGSPGVQATPIRDLVGHEPVDEPGQLTVRMYLHVQPDTGNVLAAATIPARQPEGRTMVAELKPLIDANAARRFGTPPDAETVKRTAAALEANGIGVLRAANAAEAKRIVLGLIPEGSQVHHGASQSLEQSGITDAFAESDDYEFLRPRLYSMDRKTQADEIRRLGAAPDVMLGSVHAVTEAGSLITASMGGSQLGPYVSGAGRVILVVGTQKIVSDLEEGLERVNEYALPLEDARAMAAYGIHSAVNKVLIINREITPGRITVVLVDEALGF